MFLKTYGVIYEQNSKIFSELFQNLKLYYKGQDLNLEDVLENFFETLMQHMFKLLNTNYAFDAQYLQCVTESMDELKPFGDVPSKLSTQVKRAFIGARTFHQGLVIGREVINTFSKVVAVFCLILTNYFDFMDITIIYLYYYYLLLLFYMILKLVKY